jgi:preprotein translocase subunit SecG
LLLSKYPEYKAVFAKSGILENSAIPKTNGVLGLAHLSFYIFEVVMEVHEIVLLVVFVIIAVLLILLVLIQNEEGDSLGGIFAGGSASAFGSRSGNILTRTTSIFGAVFLMLCLGLALMNRAPRATGVEAEARRQAAGQEDEGWFSGEDETDVQSPALESPLPSVEE